VHPDINLLKTLKKTFQIYDPTEMVITDTKGVMQTGLRREVAEHLFSPFSKFFFRNEIGTLRVNLTKPKATYVGWMKGIGSCVLASTC
jgi:hypothetical protein